MASVAYDKALQLDKSNTSAQMKLALVKDIFTPAGLDKTKSAKSVTAKTAALANPPVPPTPAGNPGKTTAASGEPGKTEATKPEAAKTETAKTDTAPPEPAKTAKAKKPGSPKSQVEQTVLDWAMAWSNRDVPAYLAFYAQNFQLPGGMDRPAWEVQRNQRITRPSEIKVELSKLSVQVNGKTAKATFSQRYESNLLKSTTRKTLSLENQDGEWKIIEEK
jgi:ketosteroid isomerase-like protein